MNKKQYVSLLKQRGELLDKIRDEELCHSKHPRYYIEALEGPFLYAIASSQHTVTSGLVEFQQLIKKLGSK